MSTDWRRRAACRSEDPELFFPIGTGAPALKQTEEAKRVCARCPVSAECLGWAMSTRQDAGVWGGLSEAERRSARRRADRKAGPRPSAAEQAVADYGREIARMRGAGVPVRTISKRLHLGEDIVKQAARLLENAGGAA